MGLRRGNPRAGHRQFGTVPGSAFALRLSVSAAALLLTWAGILPGTTAGFSDPPVGAMLAGLAVTMLLREPLVGVINAWLQSMTSSKPQLFTSITTAIEKAVLVWLPVRAAAAPPRFAGCGQSHGHIGIVLIVYTSVSTAVSFAGTGPHAF